MEETIDITTSWHAYPKSLAVGHRYLQGIFLDEVTITEKVDGSQFSFGIFDGEIRCKSKNQQISLDEGRAILGMFGKAVDTVREIADQLTDGYTYRAEYLAKPKHNVLAYDRTPTKNLIIFDIARGHEDYLSYEEMKTMSDYIGLECVPLIYYGKVVDAEVFIQMLDRESILGGQQIEGVVAKNYERFGKDGKVLMAKFVSNKFKEVHNKDYKEANPSGLDMIGTLGAKYHSEARFMKAVQHLKEDGQLVNEPRDIGILIEEVRCDILNECTEEIKNDLFRWAWKRLSKSVIAGFPEWYKDLLLEGAFADGEETEVSDVIKLGASEGDDVDQSEE
jgi:hypothetical protein